MFDGMKDKILSVKEMNEDEILSLAEEFENELNEISQKMTDYETTSGTYVSEISELKDKIKELKETNMRLFERCTTNNDIENDIDDEVEDEMSIDELIEEIKKEV